VKRSGPEGNSPEVATLLARRRLPIPRAACALGLLVAAAAIALAVLLWYGRAGPGSLSNIETPSQEPNEAAPAPTGQQDSSASAQAPPGTPDATGATASAAHASAGLGSPDGQIVFVCQVFRDERTNQICILNADGTGFRRLTGNDQADHFYPSLAPDGRSVWYSSNEAGEYAVYEMDLSSGDSRRLTSLGDDYAPAMSPDGREVVFVHNDGQRQTLWVVDRAGGTPRTLAATSGGDGWDPVWSPDGGQILFASSRAGGVQLFVAEVAGSSVRQVTNVEGLRGRSDWSPDGEFLATYAGSSWEREIILLDLEGSLLSQPTQGGNNLAPSISPDGEWIAFTSYRDRYKDDHGCEIYIMRKDGSELRRLTDNDYCDWQPRWGR
jgi:tol-pal system beta propeller repeat protein TolB